MRSFFCSVSIRVCIYVLCGFVTSKRVFLRVFSLGCCCCCCCVFFATIHCFTFHYCFFFIVFYALSLSCTDMILLGVNCTTGGIRGVWGGRLNNTSGATRRVYNFALYVFSSLLHACSLYIFLYIFLSRSRFLSFLTEHFVFLEKKKAKNSSTRAFLGLSLTNLLFTLRRCYFVWFL